MRKVLFVFMILLGVSAYAQQRKVALIIGNEKYQGHFSMLHTPRNDAFAVNNVLKKLGFETIVCYDLRRDSMSYYIERFAKASNGAQLSLFYYSGHAGIGKNEDYYLAPSGEYYSVSSLKDDCYRFSAIEDRLKKVSVENKIYIIDACRNSIEGSKQIVVYTPQTIEKNISNSRGSVYCFATGVNKVAQTGSGKYSIFTKSLLAHLGDFENLNVIFDKISREVTRANPEQTPNLRESPEGHSKNIYLNPNYIEIYDWNLEGVEKCIITATPSNASITIGDQEIPSGSEVFLKYGKSYPYTVKAEGYETEDGVIKANPYNTTYPFVLHKLASSSLRINCNVSGSEVYMDNKSLGTVPVTVETYSGYHSIRIEHKGYYSYTEKRVVKEGSDNLYAILDKEPKWFWDYDDDMLGVVSYHFSPKYQIGLSFMYVPEDWHFAFGAIFGFSAGYFRGWEMPTLITTQSQSVDITIGTENGSTTSGYREEVSTIDGSNESYSSLIDPYDEAKHYDANALLLANFGYRPCNGIMIETGIGAGYHRDLYYMDNTYLLKKTIKTDLITGIVTETPYEYESQSGSKWYKDTGKWSPAVRLGLKFFIPIERYKERLITLGGGYTYLPSINKYSSWDVNIGFSWTF